MPVTHNFSPTASDVGDVNIVQPSNWNANHVVSLTLAAELPVLAPALNLKALSFGGF